MNVQRRSDSLICFAAGICLAALVLTVLLMPSRVSAAEVPGEDGVRSLTVRYQDGDIPITGAEFRLCRIAACTGPMQWELTERFAGYPIQTGCCSPEEWNDLADTLKGFVLRDGLLPDAAAVTDAAGEAVYRELQNGLYLLLGDVTSAGGMTYTPKAAIISLPGADGAEDVTVTPKYGKQRDAAPEDRVTRKVLKRWAEDSKNMRPEKITVHLFAGGTVYDTVTLTAENGWKYTWEDLPACDPAGRKIDWSVSEDPIPHYEVKIAQSGITFLITNTSDGTYPPNQPPEVPQTGQLWWPVAPLLSCGGILLTVGLKRRSEDVIR